METKDLLGMDEDTWRLYVDSELRSSGSWRLEHQRALEENTALTKSVATSQGDLVKNTSEIVEALKLTKKGVNFMTGVGWWLHRIAKWCLPLVTLGGIIWAIMHGEWPNRGG